MEKWRKEFKRKLNTKAFINVDFYPHLENIFVDDNVSEETMSLKTVCEEIIYYWDKINEPGTDINRTISSINKGNFKSVSNNFLKKYGEKKLIDDYYKKSNKVKIEDGKVLLN